MISVPELILDGPYMMPRVFPGEVMVDNPVGVRDTYPDGSYAGVTRWHIWRCTIEEWLTGDFEFESNG
jgi:hypothetical protein